MNIEDIHKKAAVCTKCGEVGPERFNEESAARAARDAGWTDLCPDCRKTKPAKQ